MNLRVPVLVCFCHTDTSKIKVLRNIEPDEDWDTLIEEADKRGEYARILGSDEEIGEIEYRLAMNSLNYRNYVEQQHDS